MQQIGLFDTKNLNIGSTSNANKNANITVDDHVKATTSTTAYNSLYNIAFYPDFYSWWHSAILCLEQQVDPSTIWWTEDTKAPRVTRKRLSRRYDGFVQDATAASCHRSEDRWALLYSLLWRLAHNESQLMELSGDPEVTKLRKYAKAVARDVHKMKAFVRFRKVESTGHLAGDASHQHSNDASDSTCRYVSWFEPQHFIVEYAAPFFKRRFSNMRWSILTPVGCAHWEADGNLWFSEPVDKNVAPENDQFEEAWRVYYKSIFNPARLKTSAMQSEMPKKYWKNLPEAREITALVESAEDRTREMISQRKTSDNFHCGARPAHPNQIVRQQINRTGSSSLETLKLQASLCTGCPLSNAATQTVFGEGPDNARLMIIGEQPGDEEDLHGRPFVGPAGQVLNSALKQAGIDRDQCYLTNAVKHFGFVPRGKKRLHKRPEASVVSACGHWLEQELNCVNPDIIVYLGATAASTCFGRQVRVSRDRGKITVKDKRRHLITAHPSSILQLDHAVTKQHAYYHFVEDLKQCAELLTTVR